MRIFNLNAPAVFSGLVLGRSAGVPSHLNLFRDVLHMKGAGIVVS